MEVLCQTRRGIVTVRWFADVAMGWVGMVPPIFPTDLSGPRLSPLLVGPLFPTGLSGPHFLVLARLGLGYFVVVVVLVRVREQVLVGSIHALLGLGICLVEGGESLLCEAREDKSSVALGPLREGRRMFLSGTQLTLNPTNLYMVGLEPPFAGTREPPAGPRLLHFYYYLPAHETQVGEEKTWKPVYLQ